MKTMTTITRNGRKYALVPLGQWRKLARSAQVKSALPPLPPAGAGGERDALAYARVSIARTLIEQRTKAGLSQAELARRAGMDRSTLNRIERAKVTLDESTYRRLVRAMSTGPK